MRLLPKPALGQHHADIGHHRFGQDAGHIAGCQRGLQRREIVELDHARGLGEFMHLTEQTVTLHRLAPDKIDKHILNGTVVAAVKHQQDFALCRCTNPAQHEAIGIGGRHGELPHRQSKTLRQCFRHDGCILAGQHGGATALGLCCEGA